MIKPGMDATNERYVRENVRGLASSLRTRDSGFWEANFEVVLSFLDRIADGEDATLQAVTEAAPCG